MELFLTDYHKYENGETFINLKEFTRQVEVEIGRRSSESVPHADLSSSGCFIQ